jgi:spermidine dehydrogenase
LKLDPAPGKGMNRDVIPSEEAENYFYHFPDGNASIARSLVRRLVPETLSGKSVDDLITTKANYARLVAGSHSVEQHRGASAACWRRCFGEGS